MKAKKIITSIASLCITGIMLASSTLPSNTITPAVRTMGIAEAKMDYQSILDEFKESEMYVENNTTYFTGLQTFDAELFESFDNVSDEDLTSIEGCRVKYEFTYNIETSIVTIYAELQNEANEILIDEISGIAFINDSGNVDAYMNVDGESMLLSDMQNIGMVENCGWLSKLVKGAAAVAATSVALAVGGVGAAAVVSTALVTAAPVVSAAEKNIPANNKAHNKKNTEPAGYICGQAYYSDWKFGLSTLNHNGCGIIATYNVLRKFGKSPNLTNIIYDFDSRSGSLAMGYFGADPTHISQYLREKGLSCTSYSTFSSLQTAMSKMKTSQMVIVCAWNGETVESGAHYVAIEKVGNNSYNVFNLNNHKTDATPKTKIDKSLIGGDLIVAYIVG